MSKFLVVSLKHELLPFANRLMSEGHKVDVVVWKRRFESAWAGRIEPAIRRSKGEFRAELWEDYAKQAATGELVVLTNVNALGTVFGEHVYGIVEGPPCQNDLRFGGWFTGEAIVAPHLLAVDRGAWTGDLGPAVDGAMTMVNAHEVPEQLTEAVEQTTQHLKESHFRGLFQVDFGIREGKLEPERVQAGWPSLQTHCFFSQLGIDKTILGHVPQASERYVVALPLTVPPWPNIQASGSRLSQVNGLSPQQLGRVWWHDVQFDLAERQLSTAGLDGLLGVAIGAAHNLELARSQALEIAGTLGVPEKQFRLDVGSRVQASLGLLEDRLQIRLG